MSEPAFFTLLFHYFFPENWGGLEGEGVWGRKRAVLNK